MDRTGFGSTANIIGQITNPNQLQQMLKNPQYAGFTAVIIARLTELNHLRQAGQGAQPPQPTVAQQAMQGMPEQPMQGMARGGIIAFKHGGEVKGYAKGDQVAFNDDWGIPGTATDQAEGTTGLSVSEPKGKGKSRGVRPYFPSGPYAETPIDPDLLYVPGSPYTVPNVPSTQVPIGSEPQKLMASAMPPGIPGVKLMQSVKQPTQDWEGFLGSRVPSETPNPAVPPPLAAQGPIGAVPSRLPLADGYNAPGHEGTTHTDVTPRSISDLMSELRTAAGNNEYSEMLKKRIAQQEGLTGPMGMVRFGLGMADRATTHPQGGLLGAATAGGIGALQGYTTEQESQQKALENLAATQRGEDVGILKTAVGEYGANTRARIAADQLAAHMKHYEAAMKAGQSGQAMKEMSAAHNVAQQATALAAKTYKDTQQANGDQHPATQKALATYNIYRQKEQDIASQIAQHVASGGYGGITSLGNDPTNPLFANPTGQVHQMNPAFLPQQPR